MIFPMDSAGTWSEHSRGRINPFYISILNPVFSLNYYPLWKTVKKDGGRAEHNRFDPDLGNLKTLFYKIFAQAILFWFNEFISFTETRVGRVFGAEKKKTFKK